MFDKELLKLIGGNKKYVVYTVLLMVLGMLANIGITASICWAVYFLIEGYEPLAYIYPAITLTVAIIVRYIEPLHGESQRHAGAQGQKGLARAYLR